MSFPFKKYFLIFVLISISCGAYWFFFGNYWGTIINNETIWKFCIQHKNSTSFKNVKWYNPQSKKDITFPKTEEPVTLFFQTSFELDDVSKLTEGLIEFDYKQSVDIFFNDTHYGFFDKALILPSNTVINPKQLPIDESWRPKSIRLNGDFIQQNLKNGTNTLTLVFSNVEDLETLSFTKKELLFSSKGNSNNLKRVLRFYKPKDLFKNSTLPIFKINTLNQTIPDEPKIKARLVVANNSNGINQLSDSSFAFNIKIERRGRTSQSFPKKSYSFKLYDNNYKKQSAELVGLPASKKWVLYGPYADKSLIRNALTFSLYSQMGNYAPRFKFISLVINNNYQGIYMLTEKIQMGPNHLNIPFLKIDDVDSTKFKGGYIVDIDRYLHLGSTNYPPDSSAHPVCFQVYQPKKTNILAKEQINDQFEIFQKHIYEKDSIFNFVDINSFIDYLIITEFTKNIDGYRLSTFLYNKDINSNMPKFYLGPIWDYNFSLGLANYHEGYKPEGYIYNADIYVPFWWKTLLNDSLFSNQLENRYYELRKKTLSNKNIYNTIDSLYNICKNDAENNFKKWSVLDSPGLWPNYYLGKTYLDEINYLKNWIKKRLTFLDNDILGKKKNRVNYFEISIRNDEKWMKNIKNKAKNNNVTTEKMIIIDAKFMANQKQ